jgi:hypothetical protein
MTASTLARFARPAHKAAARAVLDTLVIADAEAFAGLSVILRAHLTPVERQYLAWAALMTCDDDEAEDIAKAVLPAESRAGWPMVPLVSVEDEAAFWAGLASPSELQAYAAACLARLPQSQRRAA